MRWNARLLPVSEGEKFSEAEFRARISSGEVWRECLYLEESEQVWHKASEYPGAVFPPPITPAPNDKKQCHRTIIVIGSLIAVVFIAAIGKGINLFAVIVGCLALTPIAWVVFPVIVLSKFNELLEVERKSLDQQRENAKALQSIAANSARDM
jgi:hypothetical protein